MEEGLAIYEELMCGVRVYPAMIKKNLERYGPFAGTEAVLMKAVERGGDRQKFHEVFRGKSFAAREEVMKGGDNPIATPLGSERAVGKWVKPGELRALMDPVSHAGDAESRCERFVKAKVDPVVAKYARKGPKGGARY